MHRGVEVGIYLRPGLEDDNYVAKALGNLAAFRLQGERKERLEWQVLRVQGTAHHHYRLVIRHPEHVLDLGFRSQLETILNDLSNESVDQLRERLRLAENSGLQSVTLRSVAQEVDFWRDDFWNWLG
ncbi:MAG: hypothetical protein WA691_05850 [Thermoplasmata archaeon]